MINYNTIADIKQRRSPPAPTIIKDSAEVVSLKARVKELEREQRRMQENCERAGHGERTQVRHTPQKGGGYFDVWKCGICEQLFGSGFKEVDFERS